jgi:hypothetical protein
LKHAIIGSETFCVNKSSGELTMGLQQWAKRGTAMGGRRRDRGRRARSLAIRPVESLEGRQLMTGNLSSGDMVLRWSEVGMDAARVDHGLNYPSEQFGPTRTSRAMAIESIAIYDAVANIDGTYQPYLTRAAVAPDASMDAAVAQAGHDTLAALYTHQVATFDQDLAADLSAIPDGPGKQAGIALGKLTAANILAARADDGSQKDAPGQPVHFTYCTQPGDWQADPLHPNATPLTPDWGSVTPFAMDSGTQFRLPPPPALDSPEYAAAFNEVKALGGGSADSPTTRTDEETTIGLFWGYDAQPGLCAPVRFYDQITDTIARQQGNTEVQNARLFVLVNVAMADAGIACWGDKYFYDFWRPVTAIRHAHQDGNPLTVADPDWTPLGAPADNGNGVNFTPPFPSYPSGHADFGGALFTVLKDFYGTDNIHFTIVSDEFNTITKDQNGVARPLVPRSYTSFTQAMVENARSRVYLGIHFQFDADNGIQQGSEIGNWVFGLVGHRAMSDNEAYVNKAYRDLTGQTPDPNTLAELTTDLNAGQARTQVVSAIENTDAYRTYVVTTEFLHLLGRVPTAKELKSDILLLERTGSQEQLEAQLMGTKEYLLHRGGGTVNGFLNAAYADLAGQAPSAQQQVALRRRLKAGASRSAIVRSIQKQPVACQYRVKVMFNELLRRAPDLTDSNDASNALLAGARPEDVMTSLMASDEYYAHL